MPHQVVWLLGFAATHFLCPAYWVLRRLLLHSFRTICTTVGFWVDTAVKLPTQFFAIWPVEVSLATIALEALCSVVPV